MSYGHGRDRRRKAGRKLPQRGLLTRRELRVVGRGGVALFAAAAAGAVVAGRDAAGGRGRAAAGVGEGGGGRVEAGGGLAEVGGVGGGGGGRGRRGVVVAPRGGVRGGRGGVGPGEAQLRRRRVCNAEKRTMVKLSSRGRRVERQKCTKERGSLTAALPSRPQTHHCMGKVITPTRAEGMRNQLSELELLLLLPPGNVKSGYVCRERDPVIKRRGSERGNLLVPSNYIGHTPPPPSVPLASAAAAAAAERNSGRTGNAASNNRSNNSTSPTHFMRYSLSHIVIAI